MYDFVGDVHGTIDELRSLLQLLGYIGDPLSHPQGRKVVFLGDYIDRGPDSISVLKIVMNMIKSGNAAAIIGNHDDKLFRYLKGNKVKLKHGLKDTVEQLEKEPKEFQNEIKDFLGAMPYRLLLDDNKVIASHAGLPEWAHLAKDSEKIRSLALYGDVNGSVDSNGFPIRKDWAKDYHGTRIVVHGHVPVKEPYICNNIFDIDTGACFGNKLTGLRYPEMELISVPSLKQYSERVW
jgi:protein phosphatase